MFVEKPLAKTKLVCYKGKVNQGRRRTIRNKWINWRKLEAKSSESKRGK